MKIGVKFSAVATTVLLTVMNEKACLMKYKKNSPMFEKNVCGALSRPEENISLKE